MSESFEVAVIDRIVDGRHAVLIVGDPPDREMVIPADRLPDGATDGTWLWVRFFGDEVTIVRIDHDETERAKGRIHDKMEQLRQRGCSTDQ